MDKTDLLDILRKYKNGKASKEEIEFLYAYYDLFDTQQDVLESLTATEVDALKQEIRAGIDEKLQEEPVGIVRTINTRYKWLAAASVLLFISITTFWYINRKRDEAVNLANTEQKTTKPVDIAPGSNQAILTLGDGSSIALDDKANGIITQQEGAFVKKTDDGHVVYDAGKNAIAAINTITTPNGGQYRLTLADGTNVWLNAASSIKFPTKFTGNTREVEITGEVYFEVAKDKLRSFNVVSQNQVIEVLGTHFNVNTYKDEPAEKTTLLEGSIKVSRIRNLLKDESTTRVLKPGQQSVLTNSKVAFRVQSTDMEEAVAWKNGYFKFDKVDIQTIMRQVARWYNVEVEYRGGISEDLFVGKIARSENVSGVLRILELSKIKTSIEGRKIIVHNH